MSQIPILIGKVLPRVDIPGVRGAHKKIEIHFTPKIFGGRVLDLTNCLVIAGFKQLKTDTVPLFTFSSLASSLNLIHIEIIPQTATTDLVSKISFMLTPNQTRLLKQVEPENKNPVWALEFTDALGIIFPLFYGECRFSEEII